MPRSMSCKESSSACKSCRTIACVCSVNQSTQRRQMPLPKLPKQLPRLRQRPGRSVARHRQQRVGDARHRAHHDDRLFVQTAEHDVPLPVGSRVASSTEVPPNFITIMPAPSLLQ